MTISAKESVPEVAFAVAHQRFDQKNEMFKRSQMVCECRKLFCFLGQKPHRLCKLYPRLPVQQAPPKDSRSFAIHDSQEAKWITQKAVT